MDMAMHPAMIRGMGGGNGKKPPPNPEPLCVVGEELLPNISVAIVGGCTNLQGGFMTALKGIGDKRSRFFVISNIKLIHTIVLADIVLVCFDRSDFDSLHDAKDWANRSQRHAGNATLLLVGLSSGDMEVKRQVVAEANGLYKLYGAKYYMQCNILSRLEVVDVFMTTTVEALATIEKDRLTQPIPEPHIRQNANFSLIGKLHGHGHHSKSKKLSFASSTKPASTRNSLKYTDNMVLDAQSMINPGVGSAAGTAGAKSPGTSPKVRRTTATKKDKERDKDKDKKKKAHKDKTSKKNNHKHSASIDSSPRPSLVVGSDLTSSPSAIFSRDSTAGAGGGLPGNLAARNRRSVPVSGTANEANGTAGGKTSAPVHSPLAGTTSQSLKSPRTPRSPIGAGAGAGAGTGRQLERRAISDSTVFFPQKSEESHHSAASAESAPGNTQTQQTTGVSPGTAHTIRAHHTTSNPTHSIPLSQKYQRSQSHTHTLQTRTPSLSQVVEGMNGIDTAVHLGVTTPAIGDLDLARSQSAAGLAQLASFVGPDVGQMEYGGGGSNRQSGNSLAHQVSQTEPSSGGVTPMSMIMDEENDGLVMITPASADRESYAQPPTRDSTNSTTSTGSQRNTEFNYDSGAIFEGLHEHAESAASSIRGSSDTVTGSEASVRTNSSTVGQSVAHCRNSQGGVSITSAGTYRNQGGMRQCLSHLTIRDHNEAARSGSGSGMKRSSFTDTAGQGERATSTGSNRRSMGDVSINSSATGIGQAVGLSQRRHSPYHNAEGVEIGVHNTHDGIFSGDEQDGSGGKREKDGKGGRFNKFFRRGSDYEDLVKVKVRSPVTSPVINMKRNATVTRLSEIKGLSAKYDVVGNPRRTKSLHMHSQSGTGRASFRKGS